MLPGGLQARKIAGRFAGDTVLEWVAPSGERVLFTGDTLNGHFNPENPLSHPRRGAPGLYLGAGPFYLQGLATEPLKASLRPLLATRIDLICGAHGEPWRDDPGGTLARLLDLDWAPFLEQGRHPVVLASPR
jgi:glyoxylase-like metal-dependent hydrolase (beta-lactamase superfamily II)